VRSVRDPLVPDRAKRTNTDGDSDGSTADSRRAASEFWVGGCFADPEVMLAKKGQGRESKLSYSGNRYCYSLQTVTVPGNLLVENRDRLIVDAEVL